MKFSFIQILLGSGKAVVTKIALDPVWWLPGVAERFGVSEEALRGTLYRETGCIYQELVTRPDLKVFLPPIGSISVYIFGKVEDLSNEKVELSLRYFSFKNGSSPILDHKLL